MAVESPGAATLRASRADDLGRLPAGVGVEGRRGVLAGGRVLEHLAARRGHQRVDPHHVALVAGAGDVDRGAGLLGGVDDLVPRHRVGLGIEPGLLGDRLAVPEQLRVGPERGGDQLVVPGRRRRPAPSRTSSVSAAASSSENGRRNPASANSGTNTGSRLIRSIELSLAASRRTSCSRWLSASPGGAPTPRCGRRRRPPRCTAPPASAWPPLSGFVYQVSVGVPLSSPPPQARTAPARSPSATGSTARW